jgi:hypothetical protein
LCSFLFFSQSLSIINHIFLFMTAITSPINAMSEPIDRYKWLWTFYNTIIITIIKQC